MATTWYHLLKRCIYLYFALVANIICGHSDVNLNTKAKDVLVFGGNGFIGSATVIKLINNGYKVTLINRGTFYWDSKFRVQSYVRVIKCDRAQPLSDCLEFERLIQEKIFWDFVIDFSGFRGTQVEQSVGALKGISRLYIYISSDSVYEVCEKSHKGPTEERDSTRPESVEERERLNLLDNYGHEKLQGEEALYKQRWAGGMPFMALRLPDVIGPRDNTYRFWMYQLLVKTAGVMKTRIPVPEFLQSYPLSFVYVDDVADLILSAVNMGPQVYDQAVNLAFSSPVTLPNFLQLIGRELGIENVPIKYEPQSEKTVYLYPSVRRGHIDITKAENLFLWQPSSISSVIKKTVKFYEDAMTHKNYSHERREVVQAVAQQFFPENSEEFHKTVETMYTIELSHPDLHRRDEL